MATQSLSLCPEGAAAQLSQGLAPGLSRRHALWEQTASHRHRPWGCPLTGQVREFEIGPTMTFLAFNGSHTLARKTCRQLVTSGGVGTNVDLRVAPKSECSSHSQD